MTLERVGTGTARFVAPALGSGQDRLGLINPAERAERARPRSVPIEDVKALAPGLYWWRAYGYDFRGGVNKEQRGFYSKVHDSLVESSFDTEFEEHAILPTRTIEQTDEDPYNLTDYWTLHHAPAFGRLFIAVYHSAAAPRNNLLSEDPADGTVGLTTYVTNSAAETITGITPVSLGGTSYLAIQRAVDAIDLIAELPVTGLEPHYEMHSNTTGCYGIIQGFVDDAALIMRCLGSDGLTWSTWTLPFDAAYGDAPVEQQTKLPPGGYAMGLSALKGSRPYTLWNFPPKDTPWGSALQPGQYASTDEATEDYRGAVWRGNVYGYDLQDISHVFGLTNIPHSVLVNNGIAASDGQQQVVWYNGEVSKPLSPFENALPNSNRLRKVTGFAVRNKKDLYITVNEVAAPGATGNTVIYRMKYNWTHDTWHVKSTKTTVAGEGIQSFMGTRDGLPVSPITGNVIERYRNGTSGSWMRQYLPEPGVNSYGQRKTVGATDGTGIEYEEEATLTGPIFTLSKLPAGGEYLVAKIWGPPTQQIKEAGTGARLTVGIGGISATFKGTEASGSNPSKDCMPHSNWVKELQWSVSASRQTGGTDPTRHAFNVLPVAAEGFYRVPSEQGPEAGLQLPEDWRIVNA